MEIKVKGKGLVLVDVSDIFYLRSIKMNSNKILYFKISLYQAPNLFLHAFQTTVKYNVMKSGDSTFEINTTISSSKQTFDKITVNVCIR